MSRTRQISRLEVAEFTITVVRHRVRTLRLSVYPNDGRIRVSAPRRTSQAAIRDFVSSRLEWLRRQLQRCQRNKLPRPSFASGERHFLWGWPRILDVVESPGKPSVSHTLERITMQVRPQTTAEQREKLLLGYYRQQVLTAIPALLAPWEVTIGVKVTKFSVRQMTSRWGSCSTRSGRIRLNSELAKRAPELLEYVLVHELVHLLEPSHNERFYQWMDRFLPNWKMWRQALRRKLTP